MSGYIYFIQAEQSKRIKIGYSVKPQARLKNLQTSNPETLQILTTFEGTRRQEKVLHAMFGAHKVRNEWFYPAQEIVDFINKPVDQARLEIQKKDRSCRIKKNGNTRKLVKIEGAEKLLLQRRILNESGASALISKILAGQIIELCRAEVGKIAGRLKSDPNLFDQAFNFANVAQIPDLQVLAFILDLFGIKRICRRRGKRGSQQRVYLIDIGALANVDKEKLRLLCDD